RSGGEAGGGGVCAARRPHRHGEGVRWRGGRGTKKNSSGAQINNISNRQVCSRGAPPPMPQIVTSGGARPRTACAQCHLPSGDGHPESANIAGLPANYIVRQLLAFKNGDRKGGRAIAMIANSKLLSDEEMKSAADYFASLKPRPGYTKVVETDMVARSYVGAGGMRFA